jgi:hypothetical protein
MGNIPVYVVTHTVAEDYNHKPGIVVTSFERIFHYLSAAKLILK